MLDNKIGFRLEKITTNQFAIIEDAYNSDNRNIELGVSFQFGVSSEFSAIQSVVKIQFEQEKQPFLIIEVTCEYGIEESKWQGFYRGKQVIIPKEFLTHLLLLTIGTTRGVLHSKTENTSFNKFILPTLDVSNKITEDGVFDQ